MSEGDAGAGPVSGDARLSLVVEDAQATPSMTSAGALVRRLHGAPGTPVTIASFTHER